MISLKGEEYNSQDPNITMKLVRAQELVSLGELVSATSLLIELLEYANQSARNISLKIDILAEFGKLYWKKGDNDKAERYLSEALQKSLNVDYKRGQAYTLNYLAHLERLRGNSEGARAYYLQCLEIRETINDLEGIANSLHNLGMVCDDLGEVNQSLKYYNKSVTIRKNMDTLTSKSDLVITLRNMAEINIRYGSLEKAEKLLLDARDLSIEIRKSDGIAEITQYLGILAWTRGNFQKAEMLLNESLQMWRELKIQDRGYVDNLATLSGVYSDLENYSKSEEYLSEAETVSNLLESEMALLYVVYYKGYLEKARNNSTSAKQHFEICLKKAKNQKILAYMLASLIDLAHIALLEFSLKYDEKYMDEAQNLINQVFNLLDEKHMVVDVLEVRIIQGMILSAQMNYYEASEVFSEVLIQSEEKKLERILIKAKVQFKKNKLRLNQARKSIRPKSQKEQVEEIQNYLNKYQQILKVFKS